MPAPASACSSAERRAAERPAGQVLASQGEQVEGDEMGGRLLSQQVDPGLGGVDALQQRLEVQPLSRAVRDDDLAVDDAPLREFGLDGGHQFREVTGHRPLVPAADLDLIPVAEHDRAEAVPLGLETERPVGYLPDGLGQHRRDRRVHR